MVTWKTHKVSLSWISQYQDHLEDKFTECRLDQTVRKIDLEKKSTECLLEFTVQRSLGRHVY